MEQRESMEHLFKLINQFVEKSKNSDHSAKSGWTNDGRSGVTLWSLSYKSGRVPLFSAVHKKNLKILIENSKRKLKSNSIYRTNGKTTTTIKGY